MNAHAEKLGVTPRHVAEYLYDVKKVACNCDFDAWEPEQKTGHTHVCRIHKLAISACYTQDNNDLLIGAAEHLAGGAA
jgi:hypothetical protein